MNVILNHGRQDLMKDDFAEYTMCRTCQQALLYCDCNCPYCGKRDECECEMSPLTFAT